MTRFEQGDVVDWTWHLPAEPDRLRHATGVVLWHHEDGYPVMVRETPNVTWQVNAHNLRLVRRGS